MKINKSLLMRYALGAIVFAISNVAAFAQSEAVRTQFSLYGMHFISAGQTVRLTVQNPRFSDSEIVPCFRVRIVFDIYEQSPTEPVRLRFVRRVSREVLLDGGEAATFDFPAGRTGDFVSPMIFVRPEGENPSEPVRSRILPTVVVREGGRTILNIPSVIKGFDPQPDPPR